MSTLILLSYVINIKVFSFVSSDTNMSGNIRLHRKMVATLQRNKLALYQTQKAKLVDNKVLFLLFCSELSTQWEISNIIEIISCVVHVLCGFSIEPLKYQKTSVSSLKTLLKHLAVLLYLLDDRPPSMFPLYLGVNIFHYATPKVMARSIPVLNLSEKSISPSSRYISFAIFYLLWALGRIWKFLHKLNFQFQFFL